MLISHNWLKKYLPELDKVDLQIIAETVSGKLAEIETIKPVRQELDKVYCAEVLSVAPVEGSKKLSFCEVELANKEVKKVICGAPNVTKGIKVALVLPGGRVYDSHSQVPGATFVVESRPVMGVVSDGMICSARELGLSNEHEGILILEPEMKLGTDIAAMLRDFVFEIENKSLSHRPDCFSHEGIAREIAAMFDLNMVNPQEDHALIPTGKLKLEVQKKAGADLCQRFVTICIADVHVHNSPLWLQSLLSAVGTRPINNIVDAANYIMFDKGQPLHTYDYDKVGTGKLIVRQARNGETIDALDEKKYTLDSDMLVISTGNKVEDIAGIMGGAGSEITSETKNIILEAANFNMYSVRKTSRKLGIRTEASTRFEKGQDPELCLSSLKSAVQIITDLAQGEIASEINDIYENPRTPATVELDLTRIKRFLGIELPTKDVVAILEKLNLVVKNAERIPNINLSPDLNQVITITAPTYRNDIKIEADLLEELARMHGYENFQPTLPKRKITAVLPNKGTKLQRKVVSSLTAAGLDELYTYTFVGPKLYSQLGMNINNCLGIRNPLTPEYSYLRDLLLPNLVEKIGLNAKKYNNFGYFEMGRVVHKALDENKIHVQPMHVAGLTYNSEDTTQYFKVKGIVENLAKDLAIEFGFEQVSGTANFRGVELLHPGRSAVITWDGKSIGFVGELHPSITLNLELKGRVGVFELDASELVKNVNYMKVFKQLSIYQAIERDLSFWVPQDVRFGIIVKTIEGLDQDLIKKVTLKDIFNKEDNTKTKSVTLSLTIQSDTKTLTDEDVNEVVNNVISTLQKVVQAELRKA